MTPGKLIKQYRTNLNMTQLELAKKLGYEIPQFVSLVENEHSHLPLGICKKVASALKLTSHQKDQLMISLVEAYRKKVRSSF